MQTQRILTSVLIPPVGACRYGCGSNCAAPVTVFWLFGLVSVVYGFLGGPTAEPGISWYTVGLGALMWAVSVIWTLLTFHGGTQQEGCVASWPTRTTPPSETETESFDPANKSH